MTERRRDTSSSGPTSWGRDGSSSGGLVKLFYRIGEVARIVGVAPHVLRYWESEFPTVKPQKSNHGQRVYTKRDVHKLLLIKHLLKEQGLTIAGARKQLRSQGTRLSQDIAQAPHETPTSITVASSSGSAALNDGADGADGAVSAAADPMGSEVAGAGEGTHAPAPSSKSLRQALLNVRTELVSWLSDLHG